MVLSELNHHRCLGCPGTKELLTIHAEIQVDCLVEHGLQEPARLILESAHPTPVASDADALGGCCVRKTLKLAFPAGLGTPSN